VFKIKHGVNGKVEHCKARPMTIAFTQTHGVQYNKTLHKWQSLCYYIVSLHLQQLKTWRSIKWTSRLHF
jgi:hypothetical protein